MSTKTFEDLIVWQKAHKYVLSIYELTEKFPKSEMFGLTSQMRRAATSIPANIAEGFKKRGRADKIRILNIARDLWKSRNTTSSLLAIFDTRTLATFVRFWTRQASC